ncbi:MAG TPA: AAA family ATPase [Pseudolabrys sp.]
MSNGAEISAAVSDEIASWRRVFAGHNGADARDLLRTAAAELWQILEIDRTVHPESHAMTRQEVVDALYDMAVIGGIGPDDAQLIFAESFKDNPHVNGNGKGNGHTGNKTAGNANCFLWRDHVFTAAELQRKTFPPVSYCVPDLIPEGLTIIAGKPKIGKSWLALDVCLAVAAGRFCLGERKPVQGDVLYAAMEDNPRRLQRRIDRVLSPISAQWPERLTLANSWRRLDKGGVDDIAQWIEQAGSPRLVVLDTLAGVKPIRIQQGGYTEDYESLAALHRLANEKGVSILVLHHTRKMEADDPVDTVSGTLGLTGCADSVLVLNRSAQGTTLYIRGRDIEEAEHAVTFDKHSCKWTILGNASDVHRSHERSSILAVLDEATEPMGPSDIAAAANMPVNNAKQLLHKMAASGEVGKVGRGQYVRPGTSSSGPPVTSVTR